MKKILSLLMVIILSSAMFSCSLKPKELLVFNVSTGGTEGNGEELSFNGFSDYEKYHIHEREVEKNIPIAKTAEIDFLDKHITGTYWKTYKTNAYTEYVFKTQDGDILFALNKDYQLLYYHTNKANSDQVNDKDYCYERALEIVQKLYPNDNFISSRFMKKDDTKRYGFEFVILHNEIIIAQFWVFVFFNGEISAVTDSLKGYIDIYRGFSDKEIKDMENAAKKADEKMAQIMSKEENKECAEISKYMIINQDKKRFIICDYDIIGYDSLESWSQRVQIWSEF